MFDSTYVSCPMIGFGHALEITTKEYNKVNGAPQYDVHYPTTLYTLEELGADLDKAHDLFLEESRAAFDSAYSAFLDADLIDLDEPEALYKASEMWNKDEFDHEPACGDCGGCCECLGDPPDCRWDTTAERDEELSW